MAMRVVNENVIALWQPRRKSIAGALKGERIMLIISALTAYGSARK